MDAGGLIVVDRNDRRTVPLLARARETGSRVTVRRVLSLKPSANRNGRRVWPGCCGSRPLTSSLSTGLMPRTSDDYLLRAGRRMLWMLTLSSALAACLLNRSSPPIRMIFGLSIPPFAL